MGSFPAILSMGLSATRTGRPSFRISTAPDATWKKPFLSSPDREEFSIAEEETRINDLIAHVEIHGFYPFQNKLFPLHHGRGPHTGVLDVCIGVQRLVREQDGKASR